MSVEHSPDQSDAKPSAEQFLVQEAMPKTFKAVQVRLRELGIRFPSNKSTKSTILNTLSIATAAALDFKARLYRRDHRRNVARKVHLEQEKRLEDKLEQVLTPLFEQEIEETVARLLELAPEEPAEVKTTDSSPLLSLAFDSNDPKWKRELIDRALPVLAVGMLEAMTAQMMETGVDPRRKGTKHLPGQHNQMSHGRGGGGAVVPDALGRQVYIDEEGHARTGPGGKSYINPTVWDVWPKPEK